jgi:flagellar basal-body rod protein FlgG
MNHSMINALVSMQSMQKKMDIIANNIANINTVGYKGQKASFQDVLTRMVAQPETFAQAGRMTPLGFTQGGGARLGRVSADFTQGALQSTGQDLDLALVGDGLFEVERSGEDGGNPAAAWTRGGSFQLSPNPADPNETFLTTKEGYFVRDINDLPLMIPAGRSIRIDEDGVVWHYDPNEQTDFARAGQLKIVRAVRPDVLLRSGDNVFTLPDGVTAEEALAPNEVNEAGEPAVKVLQGFLEQSNVDLAQELSELIAVQRAYQLNARAISSSDTLMSLTNNLRA